MRLPFPIEEKEEVVSHVELLPRDQEQVPHHVEVEVFHEVEVPHHQPRKRLLLPHLPTFNNNPLHQQEEDHPQEEEADLVLDNPLHHKEADQEEEVHQEQGLEEDQEVEEVFPHLLLVEGDNLHNNLFRDCKSICLIFKKRCVFEGNEKKKWYNTLYSRLSL